jgi:large subunit ribosomal protein L10
MRFEQKEQIVQDLHERFSRARVVILTDYKGLNVEKLNTLRRKLKENDVEYQVAKNTLVNRASQDTQVALISDALVGPTAVALSYADPVAPAKVLKEFAKENEALGIKIGVLGGQVLDEKAIENLANLPSREVLLAKLLSTMNAVPTGLVTALADLPRRLMNVLQAKKEKMESGEASAA